MVLNWILRWIVVGPLIRLFFRVKVVGLENLPRRGPYILVLGPHRTEFESLIVVSYIRRHQLHFFAKQEYWEKHKILGYVMTAIGLIPLPRQAKRALIEQIQRGVEKLKEKRVLAMYPEATRGFDGAMHRGYPGAVRISLKAGGVPLVPVGLVGLGKFNPPGRGLRPGRGGELRIGAPIYPLSFRDPDQHKLAERVLEQVLSKTLVTKISREIAHLAGVRYIDEVLPIPDA